VQLALALGERSVAPRARPAVSAACRARCTSRARLAALFKREKCAQRGARAIKISGANERAHGMHAQARARARIAKSKPRVAKAKERVSHAAFLVVRCNGSGLRRERRELCIRWTSRLGDAGPIRLGRGRGGRRASVRDTALGKASQNRAVLR
jgi:hypothetical protein